MHAGRPLQQAVGLACRVSALETPENPVRRAPIEWETPSGQSARVNLQLQFSAFFGYAAAEASQAGGYPGLQCHGVLWPVVDADLPHFWPIAPPIVSGKVEGARCHPSDMSGKVVASCGLRPGGCYPWHACKAACKLHAGGR